SRSASRAPGRAALPTSAARQPACAGATPIGRCCCSPTPAASCGRCARGARGGELEDALWRGLLDAAERAGDEAAAEATTLVAEREQTLRGDRARRRESGAAGRRAGRRRRTEVLDLGLALCGTWFRDLVAVADGAAELAINADRA